MPETLVMCSPEWFAVNYEINPWMQHQIGHVSSRLAVEQWHSLFEKLSALANVKLIHGDPAWRDLVFTANAGLPLARHNKFILSNFKYPQRQGEKAIIRAWFEAEGWTCIDLPDGALFEGAGDALFDSAGRLWVGVGPRSNERMPAYLAHHIAASVRGLQLIDPRFYHLDTCFCPLPTGYALYLPEAFDDASRNALTSIFGDMLISLTLEEGLLFCANAVCIGHVIVMNQTTPRLKKLLCQLGFSVLETPLTEFMKSGGSAKCLTLSLEGWANG
jgi:N-dimethylarginine dimethylaminohydrolase